MIDTLSDERFRTYLKAAGYDQNRALELYVWNARVGAAFHLPVQAVEVALRNRINKALVRLFGANWWTSPSFLELIDRERRGDIEMVVRRIRNRQLALVTGQVVAGLSFGFWVGMLHARYNPEIWGGRLRFAFPHLPVTVDRHSVFRAASETARLRNRISHHEPIFKRNLSQDLAGIMRLLNWICPATHDWLKPQCRVPHLLRAKP